jgi:hypothetical protein
MAMLALAIQCAAEDLCHELPSTPRAVTMKLYDLIGVPRRAKQLRCAVPESALRGWQNERGKTA